MPENQSLTALSALPIFSEIPPGRAVVPVAADDGRDLHHVLIVTGNFEIAQGELYVVARGRRATIWQICEPPIAGDIVSARQLLPSAKTDSNGDLLKAMIIGRVVGLLGEAAGHKTADCDPFSFAGKNAETAEDGAPNRASEPPQSGVAMIAQTGARPAVSPERSVIMPDTHVAVAPAAPGEQPADWTELRRRAEALAAEYRSPLPAGEAGLFEAERRRRELAKGEKALYREFEPYADGEEQALAPIIDPVDDKLWRVIMCRKPETIGGIAVKLRILRENIGDADLEEGAVLDQCLKVIEREIAAGAPDRLKLTEREVRSLAAAGAADRGSDNDDAELRALFAEWKAAMEPTGGWPEDDDEAERLLDRLLEIEHRFYKIAVEGPTGLAIKAFVMVRSQRGGAGLEDPIFDIAPFNGEVEGTLYAEYRWQGSLMADVGNFVPELAPFVAAFVASVTGDDGEAIGTADDGAVVAADDDQALDEEEEDGELTEREAEIRRRVDALVTSCSGPLPPADAGLIEAERRQAALADGQHRLYEEFEWTGAEEKAAVLPAWEQADSEISEYLLDAEPEGLPGIAAQLRYLCRYPDSREDLFAKWLAVIERVAGVEIGAAEPLAAAE